MWMIDSYLPRVDDLLHFAGIANVAFDHFGVCR